jgi:hypothetical protein
MDEEATGVGAISAESIAGVLRRRAAAGDLWVPLEGSSMLPTIESPAEGLVGGFEHPKWGEVWAFVTSEGSVTVHRVLGRNRRGLWVMRGDGAPRTDGPVGEGALIGPVRALRCVGEVQGLRRSRAMALRLHLRRISGRLRWIVTRRLTPR